MKAQHTSNIAHAHVHGRDGRATTVIVGIDEAGRGPLAGPVVAGACVDMPELRDHRLIRDSKKLTGQQREEAYAWIEKHCTFGVGIAEAHEIDSIGILAATEKAMQDAVAQIAVSITPTYLIVDGRDRFWFDYPHSSVIKGDEKEPAISAASIVAKVTRDRLMIGYHQQYGLYNFCTHKGYGSPEHFAAIAKHGMCEIHRRTFIHTQ